MHIDPILKLMVMMW